MVDSMKSHKATIWVANSDVPGKRVSAVANDLSEAMQKLESQYGEGNVCGLHCEDAAVRPR